MTDAAAPHRCPPWCKADHKPGDPHPWHSADVAVIRPYRVIINSNPVIGCERVHLLDTRPWTSPSDPDRNVARESAFMTINEAYAIAEILRRATSVQAPAGEVAASAAPYAAALGELRAVGEALAEGVRILDAARPDNPPPLR